MAVIISTATIEWGKGNLSAIEANIKSFLSQITAAAPVRFWSWKHAPLKFALMSAQVGDLPNGFGEFVVVWSGELRSNERTKSARSDRTN